MNTKKFEVARRYNETADAYDKRYTKIQHTKFREVLPELDFQKHEIIVDIGGGTGLLIDFLKDIEQNIIVCDLSYEMLKIGKNKHKRCHFICADSESLPLRQSCSQKTFYFSVLQNLEESDQTLREGFRILQNNGYIVVTALTKIFEEEKLKQILEKIEFKIKKIWVLSIEDIAVLAKKKKK